VATFPKVFPSEHFRKKYLHYTDEAQGAGAAQISVSGATAAARLNGVCGVHLLEIDSIPNRCMHSLNVSSLKIPQPQYTEGNTIHKCVVVQDRKVDTSMACICCSKKELDCMLSKSYKDIVMIAILYFL
jgi:hypothetical protein